jgi:predicted amidohydrolase YtcJ
MSKREGKVTVFTAKVIITMDRGRPEATAVAVMDGKILSVGSMESIKPWLDQFDYKVDDTFKDKVITPGIRPTVTAWRGISVPPFSAE